MGNADVPIENVCACACTVLLVNSVMPSQISKGVAGRWDGHMEVDLHQPFAAYRHLRRNLYGVICTSITSG